MGIPILVFLMPAGKKRHQIGAAKTNRILFPEGKRTAAADLAASLDSGCFHPVTVKGRTYMVFRYGGPLNKIEDTVVLLSQPVGTFGEKNALRVFLCSDASLSDETILEYYAHRWPIQVLFRSRKRYIGHFLSLHSILRSVAPLSYFPEFDHL